MRTTSRMSRSIALIVLLGAAVLAAGCDASEARPLAGVPEVKGPKQELREVKQETREAVQATKDYVYAERNEFIKDMQNDLATINRTLKQISDKLERSGDKAQAAAKAKLVVLHDKAARVNAELDKVRSAPEAAWDQVKASFKKSHDDLKVSVDQSRVWLSEKIAP